MILAKTVKGWTLGEALEARNVTHQMKKLERRASCKQFRDLLELPIPDSELEDDRRTTTRAPTARRCEYLLERRRALGGCAARSAWCARKPLPLPRRQGLRRVRRGHAARTARSPPPWRSCSCCASCSRDPSIGPRGSCRSSPTRRAPSAWSRCSARSASTPPSASSTSRSTASSCSRYREKQGRPDARGGHHRGRLDGLVHRRRHRLRDPRRADDPVLHLLLDVRLPAHRRPDLGVRRRARPRLPARRHRRPHHAATARGCSTRTATATLLASAVPNVRGLRPGVRLRGRGHHRGRPAADVSRAARTSSTTSRSTTRTTRCRRCPRACEEGILRGLYRYRAAADAGASPRVQLLGSGVILLRGAARRRRCWPSSSSVAADVWSATSYQQLRDDALGRRALEPPAPRRAAARALRDAGARRRGRARSSPPPTS